MLRATVVPEIGAAEASPKQPHETPSPLARSTRRRNTTNSATAATPTNGRSTVKGCTSPTARRSSRYGKARASAGASKGRGTLRRRKVSPTSSRERSVATPLQSMITARAHSAGIRAHLLRGGGERVRNGRPRAPEAPMSVPRTARNATASI